MAALPVNIERLPASSWCAKAGRYVGYGSGTVWHIERARLGGWRAVDTRGGMPWQFAPTLAAMGRQIEAAQ